MLGNAMTTGFNLVPICFLRNDLIPRKFKHLFMNLVKAATVFIRELFGKQLSVKRALWSVHCDFNKLNYLAWCPSFFYVPSNFRFDPVENLNIDLIEPL